MEKNRLEAFSDGVIAIIITIMVLELQVPHSSDWGALLELWPVFSAYFISFMFVGIYWGNHHHLLHTVRRVNPKIMWANLHLLFWLSLVPFSTAWMGENHFSINTVVTYAVLLLLCGLAFQILQRASEASQPHDEAMKKAMNMIGKKGAFSVVLYFLSIPIAYWDVRVSFAIFLLVGMAWFVPDRNIAKALGD